MQEFSIFISGIPGKPELPPSRYMNRVFIKWFRQDNLLLCFRRFFQLKALFWRMKPAV